MKSIALLFCLVITSFLSGQTKSKSNEKQLTLNKELIAQIEITNGCYPLDSCDNFTYKLSDLMVEKLTDKFNNSSSEGFCKFIVLYWVKIDFTDGTVKTFRINGDSVKENDDWCYDIKDSDFLERLWDELNNEN